MLSMKRLGGRACGHWFGLALTSAGMVLAALASSSCRADALENAVQACGACHGASAAPAGSPYLSGQLAGFLGDTLAAFAGGERPTAVAEHKTLAPELAAALAQHYAAQKDVAWPRQDTDPALVGRGAAIYQERCANCHEDGGRESDFDAPLLAGQEKGFLVAQSLLFKSGGRRFPFKMDPSYRGLSDDDLVAVAHYFAAQEAASSAARRKKRRR